jgi:hypothetical protein
MQKTFLVFCMCLVLTAGFPVGPEGGQVLVDETLKIADELFSQ